MHSVTIQCSLTPPHISTSNQQLMHWIKLHPTFTPGGRGFQIMMEEDLHTSAERFKTFLKNETCTDELFTKRPIICIYKTEWMLLSLVFHRRKNNMRVHHDSVYILMWIQCEDELFCWCMTWPHALVKRLTLLFFIFLQWLWKFGVAAVGICGLCAFSSLARQQWICGRSHKHFFSTITRSSWSRTSSRSPIY